MQYAELAKQWGVSFIQLLEPKSVGHYAGKDVYLSKEKISVLEDFYTTYNYNKAYVNYPTIVYHGFYSRRIGCGAGGKHYVYIDTDGDVHNCPFCREKYFLPCDEPIEENMRHDEQRMQRLHQFIQNPTVMKPWNYLILLFVPGLVIAGYMLGGWWNFLVPLFCFVVYPFINFFMSALPEKTRSNKIYSSSAYSNVALSFVPVLLILTGWTVYAAGTPQLISLHLQDLLYQSAW